MQSKTPKTTPVSIDINVNLLTDHCFGSDLSYTNNRTKPMIKTIRAYPVWLNLLGYQLLWFLAVFTGNYSLIAFSIGLAAHLWLTSERLKEFTLMMFCTVIGVTIDSVLTVSGVYLFDPQPTGLPIPLWLVGIWLAFSATLRHGLRFFIARPPLALLSAAIGAPFAYMSASRLGAVVFPLGYLNTALIVAAAWVPLMALLIVTSRWIDSKA